VYARTEAFVPERLSGMSGAGRERWGSAGLPPDGAGPHGMYSIITMSTTETADTVTLIDQGADVHAKDIIGYTPLHYV
jgi:hypothetical protein